MKKTKKAAVQYAVPEGYYLPVDKKALNKKWISTDIWLFLMLILCLFLVYNVVLSTTQALGTSPSASFQQLQPYDKSEIRFQEETQTVDAAYYQVTLPADYEQTQESALSTIFQKQKDGLEYRVIFQKGRDVFSQEDFEADFNAEQKEKAEQIFVDILGYNPFSSHYASFKAPYDIHFRDFFPLSKERFYFCNILLMQKMVTSAGLKEIYALDTSTYCGFMQIMETTQENYVSVSLQLYEKTDLNICYQVVLRLPEQALEEAFAIVNSLEFLPNTDTLAQEFEAQRTAEEKAEAEEEQQNASLPNESAN